MQWMFIIGYADTYMPLITLIFYFSLLDKISGKENILLVYCVINVILFGISNFMVYEKTNNLAIYHLQSLLEVFFSSYYILNLLFKKSYLKWFFFISGCYFLFWICSILYIEPLKSFNGVSGSISNVIVLVLCMYYLFSLSKSDVILYFQKAPSFWIISGFLICASASLLVVISYEYYVLTEHNREGMNIWLIISFATILKFALIIVGLLCYKRNSFSTHMQ